MYAISTLLCLITGKASRVPKVTYCMRIFSRFSPLARLAFRARLAFTSVRLKYAKNNACSAGYCKGGYMATDGDCRVEKECACHAVNRNVN